MSHGKPENVTITLHLPAKTPLAALTSMADSIGCELRRQADRSYIARPRQAHTNSNIVKMPHRHHQFGKTTPPSGPDAA